MNSNIVVEASDIAEFECDVIVLKYAQAFYGADALVADLLARNTYNLNISPEPGKYVLLPSGGQIGADYVLFVGVPKLYLFDYAQIREFASRSLQIPAQQIPGVRHIGMTMHGMGYGLDEREAFLAQIGGLSDALRDGLAPSSLEQITIVEKSKGQDIYVKESIWPYSLAIFFLASNPESKQQVWSSPI